MVTSRAAFSEERLWGWRKASQEGVAENEQRPLEASLAWLGSGTEARGGGTSKGIKEKLHPLASRSCEAPETSRLSGLLLVSNGTSRVHVILRLEVQDL